MNSLGEDSRQWRAAFDAAAHWFTQIAARTDGRLEDQALGVWSVRDLLGHTSRALSTIESYLRPDRSDPVQVPAAPDYVRRTSGADPEQVAERGRAAGASLGDDPAGAIAALARRVRGLVRETPDEARMETIAGLMTLAEYVPTRTFELTAHTCDLVNALGLDEEPPENAIRSALRLAGEAAVADRSGRAALGVLTGRGGSGFSVL